MLCRGKYLKVKLVFVDFILRCIVHINEYIFFSLNEILTALSVNTINDTLPYSRSL